MRCPHIRILLTTVALATIAGASGAFAVDLSTNTSVRDWSGSGTLPGDNLDIEDIRGQSVADRPRPGYDAVGIRAGSFIILPSLNVSETYDDNVFATKNGKVDDFVTRVIPQVDIKSNWNNHALNFTANSDSYIYADETGEDRTDFTFGADGRLDIQRETNVIAAASYAQRHEDRGSATFSSTTASEPVEYAQADGRLALNQRFNRITATVGATYTNLNYDDVRSMAGPVLDEDLRDREIFSEALRLGYDVSPDTTLYVQGAINQRRYDIDKPVQDRDSDGYEVLVGSRFKLSNLTAGQIFVGYQDQDYDNPGFKDIDGVSYGANVDWYATALTTVHLNAASTVEESDLGGSSGYLRQVVSLSVDHELLRNLILSGSVSYENDDYEGTARNDDYYAGTLGVAYLLNRYLAVGVDYDLTDRNSTLSGLDYTRNRVAFTIRGQL